jgi:hypothetical protein
MSSSDSRHRRTRPNRRRPDALLARGGEALPVWDAEAADPVDYLASVMDRLRDARLTSPAPSVEA